MNSIRELLLLLKDNIGKILYENNDGIKSIITKDQLMNKENYKKILIYLNDGCDLLIVNGINGVIFNKCINQNEYHSKYRKYQLILEDVGLILLKSDIKSD